MRKPSSFDLRALTKAENFIDGVYKAGFAVSQEAYDKAVCTVFESLDRLEEMLTGKDYLISDRLTEADIRLFVTMVSDFQWSPFPLGI